ncbi:MAG: DNA adenine methylase, partial [Nitrosotalea sp.]
MTTFNETLTHIQNEIVDNQIINHSFKIGRQFIPIFLNKINPKKVLDTEGKYFQIENRRYTGSKAKLGYWILDLISKECKGKTFADIFAGTGIISYLASNI